MADNLALPATSGTAATDERTISGTAVHVQRVDEQGSTAIATGQVSVSTTSGTLVSARDTRKGLLLVNRGSAGVYVGTGTVTAGTGLLLQAGDSLTINTTAQVNAIAASGTQAVHYLEEYDA